jgi:hypothetical protein
MKKILLFSPLLLLLLLLIQAPPAQIAADGWQQVATGIEYREYDLPDPNNIFVTRMDRTNSSVTLESSIGQGKLVEGTEKVSNMSSRYNQAINYWGQTWGGRNRVVVAINGSYYDLYTGVPIGGMVNSGWYAKRHDDLGGGSGFTWKLDGDAFIGGCVYHRAEKQVVEYLNTGISQEIDGVNVERESDSLMLYTPQYDMHTGTGNTGVEVLVEMERPSLILPSPAYARGIVRQIHQSKGSTFIPFDHVVLSARDSAANILLSNVSLGSEIGISQEITHFDSGCSGTLSSDSWTKSYASIGGAYYYLKDGEIQEFDDPGATNKHPRTAIAYDNDYIYFIVVDGRDVANSIGMTIDELAIFTWDTLGADWGISQDGGGSSTMVVNGEVMNDTFCNNRTCMHYTFLPVVSVTESENPPEIDTYERSVANGMMMVVVEPMIQSSIYNPGDIITTTMNTTLHLGPGTNYGTISSIPKDTPITVIDHMNDLNGVLAKGSYWWRVSYSGYAGWIPEWSITTENSPILVTSPGGPFSSDECGLLCTLQLQFNKIFR